MSDVVWKNGKAKVIWTKEEKREIRKEAWKGCYRSKTFWLGILMGLCISFEVSMLIKLYL